MLRESRKEITMPPEPVKGSCLCGSVSFEFKPPSGAKQVEMVATNELGDPTTGGKP